MRYHKNDNNKQRRSPTQQHRLTEGVKNVCPSFLLSLHRLLSLSSRGRMATVFCSFVQRRRAEECREVDTSCGRRVDRRVSSSCHRKLAVFPRDSHCCVSSNVFCYIVLVILVSSSSSFRPWSLRIIVLLERRVVVHGSTVRRMASRLRSLSFLVKRPSLTILSG
jgi:hypothetical protein